MSVRYSVCRRCGKPIRGVPTRAPFITLARATRWTHVGLLRRFANHPPLIPEEDS